MIAVAIVLFSLPDAQALSTLSFRLMGLASALLLMVFLGRGLIWAAFLQMLGKKFRPAWGVKVFCKTLPAKYVPGKVWPMLGIAAMGGYGEMQFADRMTLVVWYQLSAIISGLLMGLGGLLLIAGEFTQLIFVPLLGLLVVELLYRDTVVTDLISRVAKKFGISLPRPEVGLRRLSMLQAVQWAVLGMAFWLMIKSLGYDASASIMLLQPLANTVGMLVVFTPAGLGTREAAMVGYLAPVWGDMTDAMIVAAILRVWFMVIESFAFLLSFLIRPREPTDNPTPERDEVISKRLG